MPNLKQNLNAKTFTLTLLFAAALCLAGLARPSQLVTSVHAQSAGEGTPDQAQEKAAANQFPRQRTCNLGSLQGNYADQASATVIPGGLAPAACTGIVTFDGNGKLTARESHSFNGFIVPVANYIGTYTLKADCSGTMTLTSVEQGFTTKQNFVVTEDNKEIPYVVQDEGVVSFGTMKKM
ncbi:MAG: hypothetical protein HYR56_14130 [Acidobacteria bacterium]|nr:hypothetical protein [Acidobacteriota bacterium]MBI3421648.1 hypothetical protein [Acidobacteriota bacterium]